MYSMKAAQLIRYGGKTAVKTVTNAALPPVADNEVLVQVRAASVNPFDIKVREGQARLNSGVGLPATLGGDVAGVVAAAAAGFAKGQPVYGQAGALGGHGSFAEYTPVKASQLAAKPDNVDFAQAAALPLTAVSAYQALVDHMKLQKGQKILIHGGAGGIGSLAIQLAKHIGAYVATTAAAKDTEFVKSLGADEVIDYRSQDFSTIIKDYDAVYDTIGGETNKKSYGVLREGGRLVSMAAQPDEQLVKKHDITYIAQFTRVTPERLSAVAKLVDDGQLKVMIDKVFPLDQAAEALEYLKTRHTRGKVVLEIN